MAKQTAPIQEVSRALDLVPFLSTHSHISLKELAAEFGVTEKEMAAELTTLSMCGLPGYTPYELIEIFFDSGFVSINNHEALDIPRALSNIEIASLLIGLELMRDSAGESHSELLTEIDLLIEQLQKLTGGTIHVEDDPVTSFQSILELAISRHTTVELSYSSPIRDEITLREVTPLSIYRESGFTYLSAYCHLAEDFRHFRLDRVSQLQETGRSANLPPTAATDGAEAITADVQVLRNRRAIAELLQLENLSPDGKESIQVYSPEWLIRAALAASPDLKVSQPRNLQDSIGAQARNILALYLS